MGELIRAASAVGLLQIALEPDWRRNVINFRCQRREVQRHQGCFYVPNSEGSFGVVKPGLERIRTQINTDFGKLLSVFKKFSFTEAPCLLEKEVDSHWVLAHYFGQQGQGFPVVSLADKDLDDVVKYL